MAIAATLILLLGGFLLWLLSGWLIQKQRALYISAFAATGVIVIWFATVQRTAIALQWIRWDDYVFFERIPLFWAILLLLFIALRRIQKNLRLGVIVITGLFCLYAIAEVTGPLWLGVYLDRLDDSRTGSPLLQSTGWSCGPAALAWALRENGVSVSERQAAVLTVTVPLHGVSDRGMLRGAHRLGFEAEMIHGADWEDIVTTPKPALVDLELGMTIAHAVVLLDVDDSEVVLGDPLYGRTTLSRTEFMDRWERVLMTLRSKSPGAQ
ncbi:MAG: cysteine peptidase family C39 domain-containing protein [Armatimonadota bacterium]